LRKQNTASLNLFRYWSTDNKYMKEAVSKVSHSHAELDSASMYEMTDNKILKQVQNGSKIDFGTTAANYQLRVLLFFKYCPV